MSQDLIPLQTAYFNRQRDVDENNWRLFDTKDNKLYTLPGKLSPREAMSYLHFARPFELSAFNVGIWFGKTEQKKWDDAIIEKLKKDVEFLANQNIKLSEKLEKWICGVKTMLRGL